MISFLIFKENTIHLLKIKKVSYEKSLVLTESHINPPKYSFAIIYVYVFGKLGSSSIAIKLVSILFIILNSKF